MDKYQVVYKKVGSLKPYAKNARTHSSEQISQIVKSIKEFGFTNPVLLDGQDGIIAGHGRVLAAAEIGMAEVPCIRLLHLSESQKRAYIIADNKLALNAGWDNNLLAQELMAIEADGYDLDTIGFDDEEFQEIISSFEHDQKESSGEGDECPSVNKDEPSRCKKGEIWQLGKHRLIIGDSTKEQTFKRLMDGKQADMLLTDPPYNVDYTGKTKDALKIENDKKTDGQFRQFLLDVMGLSHEALKPGGVFYIWHADSEGYNFRHACNESGLQVRQCLIWNKNVMVMGRQDYHWKHEPCLYGWKEGAAHKWTSDRTQTTILEFDRPTRNEDHPTMKPVDLLEYQIQNNSIMGDIILDPFLGSGSTLIAAEECGRICYGAELDENYGDVIIRRYEEFSGEVAQKL